MSKHPTITILGSSSATPTRDRNPSAQLYRVGSTKLLIDCGEGTQNQLIKYGIRHTGIDYICISHLHGDHYFGLIGLICSMSLIGRKQPLKLVGPPPLIKIIELQLKCAGKKLDFEIIFYPTSIDKPQLVLSNANVTISTFPLQHRIHCTGFLIREIIGDKPLNTTACNEFKVPVSFYKKIKAGEDYVSPDGEKVPNSKLTFKPETARVYAYCSDTIYDEKLAAYVEEADLLYHESTYLNQMADKAAMYFHSTALQAGIIAKKANAKKMIIGHFSTRYDNLELLLEEARSVFPQTELAIEGLTFAV